MDFTWTIVLSVIAGFLVYDFFFVPPYLTLWVGAPQNWAALGLYAVVMLPVARVVAGMNAARARERLQSREIRQLFELSDLLVEDKPLDVLLSVIVTALADVFSSRQVALFLPKAGRWRSPRPLVTRSPGSSCAGCFPPPGSRQAPKPSHISGAIFSFSP